MSSILDTRLSRRTAIKSGVAAGLALSTASWAAWAAETAALPQITKTIPSSGEKLPVIGLGTNQYSVSAPEEIAARREVLKHFPELGAKVIDTARGYGEAEVVIGNLLKELGNRDKIFLATKTQIRGQVLPGDGELEASLKRLQTNKLDLLQIHNFNGIEELFPRLQEWKKAGKVRYIGVTTSTDDQYPQIKDALNKLPLDFIQVDYSIDNRGAGEEILPLAQDKGVGVLINVPLGGRRGNVLSRVANKPLPDWAAEIDVTSWAQLFLKYNISHPAVTAVIPGTTKLTHLQDNQRAGRGRLPTAAQRKKIEEFWATV
jgi:aryl-alcohol dehydrogenase-like predicted oxidoreductase